MIIHGIIYAVPGFLILECQLFRSYVFCGLAACDLFLTLINATLVF